MSSSVTLKPVSILVWFPPPPLCWGFTSDNGYCVLLPRLSALLRKRYGRERVADHMCITLSWHDKRHAFGMQRRRQLLLTQITQSDIDYGSVYYGTIITPWISNPLQIKKANGSRSSQGWRHLWEMLMFSDHFGLAVFVRRHLLKKIKENSFVGRLWRFGITTP